MVIHTVTNACIGFLVRAVRVFMPRQRLKALHSRSVRLLTSVSRSVVFTLKDYESSTEAWLRWGRKEADAEEKSVNIYI